MEELDSSACSRTCLKTTTANKHKEIVQIDAPNQINQPIEEHHSLEALNVLLHLLRHPNLHRRVRRPVAGGQHLMMMDIY